MNSAALIETITQLISPLITAQKLKLWGIELVNIPQPTVKIFIDTIETNTLDENNLINPKPEQITIEQCASLSRLIGLTLEVEELFSSRWTLEVSSPGLERSFFTIQQLSSYINHEIDVTLKEQHPSWPGRKKFYGMLISIADNTFMLNLSLAHRKSDEPENVNIDWHQVRKATLVHHFFQPNKKLGSTKGLNGGTT